MRNKSTVSKDLVMVYGDQSDGVIGIPVITSDQRIVEASYFFGTKHPKNIIVISSQAGCPMRCSFCELGPESFGRNLSPQEISDQVYLILEEAGRYGFNHDTPHKITVANSGEPLLNPHIVDGLELVLEIPQSIKVSTVFPSARQAQEVFKHLALFASNLKDCAVQIQVSLISTSEEHRRKMSSNHVASFRKIRDAAELWRNTVPQSRKINLSLIITDDTPCDIHDVKDIFPPELFRFRFREYVPTKHGGEEGLLPVSVDRLSRIMKRFGDAGYEVGDWASPTPTERRFGLAANVIRERYLQMIRHSTST